MHESANYTIAPEANKVTEQAFALKTVGYVHENKEGARIELLDEYADSLVGLEGFSHVLVFWWCHNVDDEQYRSIVSAGKPYVNGPDEMGIFATRSPIRPNPIAVSPVVITGLDVEQGVLHTPYIDADDGSPVLDIKPYSPCLDRVRDARVPDWCAHWPAYYEENEGFDWDAEFNF